MRAKLTPTLSTARGANPRRKSAASTGVGALAVIATMGGLGFAVRARFVLARVPVVSSRALADEGQRIFRYETFGNESFWTDSLHMQNVITTSVDPTTAMSVGIKVDSDSLPPAVIQALRAGKVDLKAPATTVLLLKLNAVVGLRGTVQSVNGKDTLVRLGITCALCHSTVNDAIAPGIGKRLDGFPNHDLNPGAIIALSPAVTSAQKAVYNSWGKGKYDARFNHDGKNGPSVIPPAYGLRGIRSVTYTGDGSDIMYWNRYVAVTQMHGHGSFKEPRLPLTVNNPPDSVGPLLPALQAYQLTLLRPAAPAGSFDSAAAMRGKMVFNGAGKCSTCHVAPLLTDAPGKLHSPSEVVSEPEPNGEPSFASRSATKMFRTTPLRGLQEHPPYFHNGVAPTLQAVVDLYNTKKKLNLTAQQKSDLVEYLKTL